VTIEPRAVGLGALVAVAVAVPVAVVGDAVTDDGSAGVVAFGLAALLGFVAGGWLAGARAPAAALVNGAAAAFVAAVGAQAVVAAVRLAGDDEVSAASILANTLLATALGLAGAWLAGRRSPDPA
jgi:hypothetical protein